VPGTPWRVEAIGLGVGAAASYALPGDSWTFYEIDPLVASIASEQFDFTYLALARVRPSIVLGDARVSMSGAAPVRDNLIIVDAFSSDAVPVHLLTREALALYRSRLAPDGIIAWHVSNKYLALWRVLAALAADAQLVALVNTDVEVPRDTSGRLPSIWVVITSDAEQVSRLRVDPRWHPLRTPNPVLWTDDFSNVASILR
jgi:spermidine synthase